MLLTMINYNSSECVEKEESANMKCDECGASVENGRCTGCGKQFLQKNPAAGGSAAPNPSYVNDGNGKARKPKKFYQSTWFCVLMLLFFFPIGLFLMWKYKKFNVVIRVIITGLLLLSFIGSMISNTEDVPAAEVPNVTVPEAFVPEERNDSAEDALAVTEEIIYDLDVQDETTAVVTKEDVPREYRSALKKAETYGDMMHMSKAAIYNQLVSEYGEQFSEEAAQYAMENVVIDWNANALAKAESYSDMMHMSKAAIYDQLTSEFGEQFTADEAQYAIDNIHADWNANALEKARSYQDSMAMSPNAIYDQLISEYGEQFTAAEAQYAIDNLEK